MTVVIIGDNAFFDTSCIKILKWLKQMIIIVNILFRLLEMKALKHGNVVYICLSDFLTWNLKPVKNLS